MLGKKFYLHLELAPGLARDLAGTWLGCERKQCENVRNSFPGEVCRRGTKKSRLITSISLYLRNDTRYDQNGYNCHHDTDRVERQCL